MKTLKTIIITALITVLFCSFVSEKKTVLYLKTGTYTATNGNVKFKEEGEWRKLPADTTWRGFIVKQVKE